MEGKLNKELIEINDRNIQLENKVGHTMRELMLVGCSHDKGHCAFH